MNQQKPQPRLPPYAEQARRITRQRAARGRRELRSCLKTGISTRLGLGKRGLDTYCRLNAKAVYDLIFTPEQKAEVREEIERWECSREETLRLMTESEAVEEAALEHPDHLPLKSCPLCFGQLIAVTLRRG